MKSINRVVSVILYIVTLLDIAIVIYDLATKGTTSTLMILATVACVCISAVDIYLTVKRKI